MKPGMTTLAPDDDQGDRPHCDAVRQTFNDAWAAGDLTRACGIYVEYVKPRIVVSFTASGMAGDDAADCADDVFARMLELYSNDRAAVLDAHAYIFGDTGNRSVRRGVESNRHVLYEPDHPPVLE